MNRIFRRVLIPFSKLSLNAPETNQCRFMCSNQVLFFSPVVLKHTENNQVLVRYLPCRYKSKKAKNNTDSDDEEDFDDGDASLSRDSKIVKFSTTSLRADAILKSALGIARNKIEQKFYESKIRVNGKKILKKSVSVRIGDELDIIKSVSPKNPDHLNISRVEVLNIVANEDSINVTARRFKSLLIDNYEQDAYKGSSEEN